MGLISALNTALVGLGVNQRQLDVTASNIANADRVGYTRKVLDTSAVVGGDGQVIGTRVDGTSRLLNEQIQAQYQQSLSQQQYSSVTADFARYLDNLFGTIDDPGSLPNTANAFSASLANLVSTPEDYPSRLGVVQEAEKFASKLNSLSSQIQDQRQSIEYEIADSVDQVNVILERIKELDTDIVERQSAGTSPVELLDERDRLVTQLSGYIDVNVQPTEIGGLRINTAGGLPLYDVDVFELEFDAHGSIGATSVYSKDPEERGVGTIRITTGQGPGYDVLSLGGFQSGSIAALVEARDETLVAAQRQLDELAANLARTLSTHTEPATAYPASQVPPDDYRPVLSGVANLTALGGLPANESITVNGTSVDIQSALGTAPVVPSSFTVSGDFDDNALIDTFDGETLVITDEYGAQTSFDFDTTAVGTQLTNLQTKLNTDLAGGNSVFTVTGTGSSLTIEASDGRSFTLASGTVSSAALGISSDPDNPTAFDGTTALEAAAIDINSAFTGAGVSDVTVTADNASGELIFSGTDPDPLTISGPASTLQALGFGDGTETSYTVFNQVGFDFDLDTLENGDNYTFSFKDLNTGLSKNVTIYRSDVAGEPAITGTRDPNDIYIGIDFSSGDYDAISTAINDALTNDPRIAGALQAENLESGGTPTSGLRIFAADARDHRIENAATNYAVGGPGEFADALSLFTDTDGAVYTGVVDGRSTIDGFAGRIQVNQELVADPGLLVQYADGIASGDPSRPQALLDKLNDTKVAFSTSAKVGTNTAVFKGSALDFVTTTVSYHARNAAQAEAAAAGQEVATNNLKVRFDSSAKVDVDEELGQLIQIQNSYAANARVLQAVRELFETLIRI
ncbi:flagellar hook-associated protein FlgK [Rhizobiales bacterium]|uniref:flagellar hook-associated protein FlgK n=1 Tax=Hongsoonwoonella zoysiae TaxID=2821844 RepID=UPI0015615E28|nr:flagellar hook-associated protein FlgK [Hongsoonwoonella zoysiae]NRG18001.1 flagellar hook-associated protein FlgK [Hongsoonwoonella zoysiae]